MGERGKRRGRKGGREEKGERERVGIVTIMYLKGWHARTHIQEKSLICKFVCLLPMCSSQSGGSQYQILKQLDSQHLMSESKMLVVRNILKNKQHSITLIKPCLSKMLVRTDILHTRSSQTQKLTSFARLMGYFTFKQQLAQKVILPYLMLVRRDILHTSLNNLA